MEQWKLLSGAALVAIGTTIVLASASFAAGDRTFAEIDSNDIAEPTLTHPFPPGSDGMVTYANGRTFFTTRCGDRMNVAGEIVMRVEDVAAAEEKGRCGYGKRRGVMRRAMGASYEECARAVRAQFPFPCRRDAASAGAEAVP